LIISKLCLDKRELPPGDVGYKIRTRKRAEKPTKGDAEGKQPLSSRLLHLDIENEHDCFKIDDAHVEEGVSKVKA